MEQTHNSFRRGIMSLVILALLNKEDMYGYQLVQQTAALSGGRITTQEGSLYPVLYKLQQLMGEFDSLVRGIQLITAEKSE